jgi:hydroxyacylglutathione hydrolase
MKSWTTKNNYTISRVLSGRSNVFLVEGNGKTILIDSSPAYKWEKLKKKLDNLNISKIDYLILTHTHFDHAGNALKIKSHFGSAVIVNKQEAGYLEEGKNTMLHGTVFFLRFAVKKIAPMILPKISYEPCHPDILADQYLNLNDFGLNGYILHTPGHSPGSQSIIIDDEIALTGDAMFGIFPGSIFPPFAENDEELVRSWGKLLETKCSLFLPSHGSQNSRKLVSREFNRRRRI